MRLQPFAIVLATVFVAGLGDRTRLRGIRRRGAGFIAIGIRTIMNAGGD